jgi:pantetheine-phosphate adenylyltransferase
MNNQTGKKFAHRVAVYPGSFDPVTNGHLDIIQRASQQFDHLIVAVLNNMSKTPLFSVEERVAMMKEITKDMPNVEVDWFRDLLVSYMQSKKANIIVRGIRSVSDFEYELQMASMNRQLDESVDTIFMMTNPKFSYLSSSLVKEIAKFHGNVNDFVPPIVVEALKAKYSSKA